MNREAKNKAALKIACAVGILLLLLFLGLTLGTAFISKTGLPPLRDGSASSDFYQVLYLFDKVLSMETLNGRPNHTHVGNLLKELEKSAVGTESWLSLLKRYRKLSKQYDEYVEGYRAAVALAEKKYPRSALIAALSSEAELSAGTAAPVEKLKETALLLSESGLLSQAAFFPVAFCLYAVCGSFDTIDSTRAVKRAAALFDGFNGRLRETDSGNGTAGRVREGMLVDAALLKIVDGRTEEAAAGLVRLEPDKAGLPTTRSFIANYSFDFASPLLAAELWAKNGSEKDLARAASALYIAGETENSRGLWMLLIKNVAGDSATRKMYSASQGKALYNIAATAENVSEKILYLTPLIAGTESGNYDRNTVNAGIVMYTRLQTEDRARAILSDYPFTMRTALLDLEYLRRGLETMPPDRAVAETWLLLDRHPDAEELYRWAAWYFEYQRRYEDLEALQRFAAQNRVESPFLTFHRALRLAREGNISDGLELLESSDVTPAWQREANIALFLYSRREFAAALRHWEEAVSMIRDDSSPFLRQTGAKIYLKMARCRRILGGGAEEIRRDLERAGSLDGENIDVRLALRAMKGGE